MYPQDTKSPYWSRNLPLVNFDLKSGFLKTQPKVESHRWLWLSKIKCLVHLPNTMVNTYRISYHLKKPGRLDKLVSYWCYAARCTKNLKFSLWLQHQNLTRRTEDFPLHVSNKYTIHSNGRQTVDLPRRIVQKQCVPPEVHLLEFLVALKTDGNNVKLNI